MSLHPTPTRLALLRDVRDGKVFTHVIERGDEGAEYVAYLFPDAPTSWQDRQRVDARMVELERAGWVDEAWEDESKADGEWWLTDAGRVVLDGA